MQGWWGSKSKMILLYIWSLLVLVLIRIMGQFMPPTSISAGQGGRDLHSRRLLSSGYNGTFVVLTLMADNWSLAKTHKRWMTVSVRGWMLCVDQF